MPGLLQPFDLWFLFWIRCTCQTSNLGVKSHTQKMSTQRKQRTINLSFDPLFVSQWVSLQSCCLEVVSLITQNQCTSGHPQCSFSCRENNVQLPTWLFLISNKYQTWTEVHRFQSPSFVSLFLVNNWGHSDTYQSLHIQFAEGSLLVLQMGSKWKFVYKEKW